MIAKSGFLLTLFFLTVFCRATAGQSCFVDGACDANSFHVGGDVVKNKEQCLQLCKDALNCDWFTFYPGSKYCHLTTKCSLVTTPESCPDCVSGQSECRVPECWFSGRCDGDNATVIPAVISREACARHCQASGGSCQWFSYSSVAYECILYETCPTKVDDPDFVSGEVACEVQPEAEWHMLVGGRSGDVDQATAELFNWVTGKQCRLPDLPEVMVKPIGGVLDGVPVVCGTRCYKFSVAKNNWLRTHHPVKPISDGGSAVVDGQGLVVFGGNDLVVSQKLADVDGAWDNGTALYENKPVKAHCVLQINDFETAFFGGSVYGQGVITYDWRTSMFTKHGVDLVMARNGSACALFRHSDDSVRVAIVGGTNMGMELWNPDDGTTELLFAKLPHENGSAEGLSYSSVLPVKGGNELIMYGGWKGSHHKGVWRYTAADNTWVRIGSTVIARGEHVTIPVHGIACP